MQPWLKYVLLFIRLWFPQQIDFDKSEAYGQNTMRAYETELAIKDKTVLLFNQVYEPWSKVINLSILKHFTNSMCWLLKVLAAI